MLWELAESESIKRFYGFVRDREGIKSEDVHSERAYGIQLKGGCRTMRAFTPTPPILLIPATI